MKYNAVNKVRTEGVFDLDGLATNRTINILGVVDLETIVVLHVKPFETFLEVVGQLYDSTR